MDHVEECPSYYVDCLGTICDCDYEHICMCRELRACEQRMLDDDVLSAAYHGQKGYDVGYAAALDAAREAVLGSKSLNVASPRALNNEARFVWMDHALEAIDALRKDGND